MCFDYLQINGATPGADPGFFAGGGGQRRPCTAGTRANGGSRVDNHQIKVHSVHRIFRAIFFFFCYSFGFLAIVFGKVC